MAQYSVPLTKRYQMRQAVNLKKIPNKDLERVSRMYLSNEMAGRAIGVCGASFTRECKKRGIKPPSERN